MLHRWPARLPKPGPGVPLALWAPRPSVLSRLVSGVRSSAVRRGSGRVPSRVGTGPPTGPACRLVLMIAGRLPRGGPSPTDDAALLLKRPPMAVVRGPGPLAAGTGLEHSCRRNTAPDAVRVWRGVRARISRRRSRRSGGPRGPRGSAAPGPPTPGWPSEATRRAGRARPGPLRSSGRPRLCGCPHDRQPSDPGRQPPVLRALRSPLCADPHDSQPPAHRLRRQLARRNPIAWMRPTDGA